MLAAFTKEQGYQEWPSEASCFLACGRCHFLGSDVHFRTLFDHWEVLCKYSQGIPRDKSHFKGRTILLTLFL